MKKITLFVVLILVLSSCSAENNTQPSLSGTISEHSSAEQQLTDEHEKICFDFIKNEMITQQGGVRTNYLDTVHDENLATGAEVLSESMGLLMLYAVAAHDEALFKSSLDFVQENLDTGNIISYRYSVENGSYHVNAFIDDIRIIRALILADGVFNGKYRDIARKYSDRLYDTNVVDGIVFDMYDDANGINNDFITLCYVDLYTMQLLKKYDARWDKVFSVMRDIVKQSYISDDFPMHASSYSYASETYRNGDVNMVEATLTALNLARVDECPQETIDYLKDSIKNGAIYGLYSYDGKKKSDIESTAIYAICALIAKEAQDEDMYRLCIDKMKRFQVMDEKSEIYGAFADPVTLELYAFDNLMALLAYSQKVK